jgi:hypothetical protein
MLPAKVPKSRIIVYSYESRWHAQLCGDELVHSIYSFRSGASDRPIVLSAIAYVELSSNM